MVFVRSHARAVTLVMLGHPLIGVDHDNGTALYLFNDLAKKDSVRWGEVSHRLSEQAATAAKSGAQ